MQKLYAQYRKWRTKKFKSEDGIVVGADLNQQWLLPWWWSHYHRFNAYPVAFVDFGMSEEMKKWCRERGEWIDLPVADIFVAEREEIEPTLVQEMENASGDTFWPSRNAWFKKPLACLQSPFLRSIWIDLDCQICGPLNELFPFCKQRMALAREQFDLAAKKTSYNTGVIAFKHGNPTMKDWADQSFKNNHKFRGDQDIFNAMVQEQGLTITELSPIYNWSRLKEQNPLAVIVHWHGPQGKSQILHEVSRTHLKSLLLIR